MKETNIKVRYAQKKIDFTNYRIRLLCEWDAPKHLEKLKSHCIAVLCDRVSFLKDHAAKPEMKMYTAVPSNFSENENYVKNDDDTITITKTGKYNVSSNGILCLNKI